MFPSPRKILNFLEKFFGIIFLSIGLILLFITLEIPFCKSPCKELMGFVLSVTGSFLLFKGIYEDL